MVIGRGGGRHRYVDTLPRDIYFGLGAKKPSLSPVSEYLERTDADLFVTHIVVCSLVKILQQL